MSSFTPTQVIPLVTKVSAASVNTPNNEQSYAFNDHISGVAWQHPANAINVATQTNNTVMDNTASDLFTVITRITTAIFKSVNPDASNWATAIQLLGTTENLHDVYTLLLSHSHADNTHGGQLLQSNTHGTADTDGSAIALHHTLGIGQFQAAAGTHTHAIYTLVSDKNAANGYPGLTSGLIADNQLSTNIARVVDMNTGNNNLQTQINTKSGIGHVHGTGSEVKVTTAGLADSAVTAIILADNAVTTNKLIDGSITSVKILDNTIVGSSKLADKSVTSAKIADNTITSLQLADNGVTSAKIADANVTATKLGANAVTNTALGPLSVDSRVLATDSVTTLKILDLSVTSGKLAPNAVTDAKIQSGGLTGVSYGTASIDGGIKLIDYSITQKKMAIGSITPTSPPSYSINVAPVRKWNNLRNAIEYSGGILDLQSSIPTSSGLQRYVYIGVNSLGYVDIFRGDLTSGTPIKPPRLADTTGLGFALLWYSMPSINVNDLYPWVGPDDGASGVGGSPIGHNHGLSNESRVGSIGLDEGFARPTDNPTLSVNVSGLHYRHSSGQTRFWGGGLPSFGANAGGMQCIGVYFDTSAGQPVQVAGTVAVSNPTRPSFIGDQRSLFYVFTRPNMTFIGTQDDGVNGWIEDARQWIGGGGGPTTVNTVPTGGTGVASFVAGLVSSPGGTAALTSVPGPVGALVGTSDAQTLTNKVFTNATVTTVGTIFRHIAGTNATLVEYQNSDTSIFGNISRYGTFGFGGAETTGNRRVFIAGSLIGNGAAQIVIAGLTSANANSQTVYSSSIASSYASAGFTGVAAIGLNISMTRNGGDTGTVAQTIALQATAGNFGTANYAAVFTGGTTQVNGSFVATSGATISGGVLAAQAGLSVTGTFTTAAITASGLITANAGVSIPTGGLNFAGAAVSTGGAAGYQMGDRSDGSYNTLLYRQNHISYQYDVASVANVIGTYMNGANVGGFDHMGYSGLPLTTHWSNSSGAYRKEKGTGNVKVRGLIVSTAAMVMPSVLFQLAVGSRPVASHGWLIPAYFTTTGWGWAIITADAASGNLILSVASGTPTSGASMQLYLDNITFATYN